LDNGFKLESFADSLPQSIGLVFRKGNGAADLDANAVGTLIPDLKCRG
jgi:hypothetical protein